MASLNDIQTKIKAIIDIIKVKTTTGILPLTFTAKAGNAVDWVISGNAQGVGERTVNLFNKATATAGYRISGDGAPYHDPRCTLSDYIEVSASTAYVINTYISYDDAMAQYDANKTFIERTVIGSGNFTTSATTKYVRISMLNGNVNTKMLVKGSTAPSTYVPFGYQIPLTISQQGQTDKSYNIYIGDSPLTEGETVSKTSTGVDIELFEGENTVSTTLYNKPEMTIKYKYNGGN